MGIKKEHMIKIKGIYGGRFFMASHFDIIKKFITENKLSPIEAQTFKAGEKSGSFNFSWILKYGGMFNPHFHFDGDVYTLTEEQWSKFSVSLVKDFQNKLANAKSITFQNAVEISNVIDGIS